MSDANISRHGVQRGVKRHDSTTTSSEASIELSKQPAGTSSPANQRRQEELLKKLPDSIDNAQERGERNDNAKAIATSGKSVPRKKR